MTTFAIPTLPELRQQLRTSLAARLGTEPALRHSVANVLADLIAAGLHTEHRYLVAMADNLLPVTAEAAYLERWARMIGLVRSAAAPAIGSATFTGVNGTAVPAGTVLLAADRVTRFTTDASGTIATGTATVAITAADPGAAGTLGAGAVLTLQSAIAGLDPTATVAAGGTVGGVDVESDDSLRARVLARLAAPPAGGSAADYLAWMRSRPGVTRAWVLPLADGAGTVGLWFVYDGRTSILPTSGEVTAMQAYIDSVRPVTAEATVAAPTALAVNITITDLTPDTLAVRAAVEAELADLFARAASVGDATWGDGIDDGATGGSLFRSQITAAIAAAEGVSHFILTAPSADVAADTGELPRLGTVTYA